ncbi:MAG: hypothetical protein AAF483_23925, partial [Planctomycetota bacterium]
MGRIIAATLAGAVIYFVWGMLAWMVLPIHGPTVSALPAEAAIRDAMIAQNLESGVYIVPFTEEMADPTFNERNQAGPIFNIFLRKEGLTSPMGPAKIAIGFLLDVLAAGLAVGLILCLGPCGNSFGCRVGFVTGLGVFTGMAMLAGFALLYSLYGGLKAVALTDIIQVVILILGGFAITILVLSMVGGSAGAMGGLSTLMSELPGHFEMILDRDHP